MDILVIGQAWARPLQRRIGVRLLAPEESDPRASRAPRAGLQRHEKHNRQSVERYGSAQGEADAGDAARIATNGGHLLHASPATLVKDEGRTQKRSRRGPHGVSLSTLEAPRPPPLRWQHMPHGSIPSSGETSR